MRINCNYESICLFEVVMVMCVPFQIQFQSMASTGVEEEESGSGGEIQIERIPTRTLEVRSKDLVPVFEYLRSSKNQTPR